MSPDLVWGSVAALVIFLEIVGIVGKNKDDTISEMTRKYFRTDTKLGAFAFAAAWIGFAIWYFYHIIFDVPYRKRKR